MPDYKKTEELFRAKGLSDLYKKPLAQLDDELFYAKVTNPHTNTFFQIEDLPIEYRQNKEKQNLSYQGSLPDSQDRKNGWDTVAKKQRQDSWIGQAGKRGRTLLHRSGSVFRTSYGVWIQTKGSKKPRWAQGKPIQTSLSFA